MRHPAPWLAAVLALAIWSWTGSAGGVGEETEPPGGRADAPAEALETGAAPTPALPYTLRQGKALFLHYCATCHGPSGRGDGFNAYSLDPKPRDLTDPEFHTLRSDRDLSEIIRIGGGAAGLSTAMPPWGRTVSQRQIDQLVAYLRSLPWEAEDAADGR